MMSAFSSERIASHVLRVYHLKPLSVRFKLRSRLILTGDSEVEFVYHSTKNRLVSIIIKVDATKDQLNYIPR